MVIEVRIAVKSKEARPRGRLLMVCPVSSFRSNGKGEIEGAD
jgi:hypothetical protein